MSRDQAYLNTVSMKLSEVLSDIGVNERMIHKRRRMTMLQEQLLTTVLRLRGMNCFVYFFGSLSEGTTTLGLRSDNDRLVCLKTLNIIQESSQLTPGKINLLMIQDETVSAGYCLLQELMPNVPVPFHEHIPNMRTVMDRRGRVLWKNSWFHGSVQPGDVIHGPAHSGCGQPGFTDYDNVHAFHCESWPIEAEPWLEREGIGGWPTEEMKGHCVNTGCLFVPVASKCGQHKETEWRISTSHAERSLMYSLNLTQIRCYILMKMILKTFINPQCDGVISSFMCKTVLFHCIQNTHSHQWQENHLLPCLTDCLLRLQHFIREENCPHFIILENNLLAGRISAPVKQQLHEILQHIIQSEGRILLEIPFDDLGRRLNEKMNQMQTAIQQTSQYPTPDIVSSLISTKLLRNTAIYFSFLYKEHLKQVMYCNNDMARLRLSGLVFSLARVYLRTDQSCSILELLFSSICSSLGSVIASSDIHLNNTISPIAMTWILAGLDSDVSCGKLKAASALYCKGDMERVELILRIVEDKHDQDIVESVCGCSIQRLSARKIRFIMKSNSGNEELIKHMITFCVRFMRCEINCVPKELQYEMFRSTEDERLHRNERDYWMDWAVVDSLPYLYFLQYKTYGHLQRAAGQQCAITYLAATINIEPNLGHRETALNLLGQCMEQENRHNDALYCYVRSLKIRPRNNVAKIHICRLLNELVNRQSN